MSLREKIVKSGLWKALIYLLVISLMYATTMLMSFTEGDLFDFSKLGNGSYWAAYSLTIGLAVGVLFFAMIYKKDILRLKPAIEDIKDEIRALYSAIITAGLVEKLAGYIKNLNKDRRREKYKRFLQQKQLKAKTQTEIDKYSALITQASEEQYDASSAPVEITDVTISTLVDGVEITDKGDELIYTGYEKLGEWTLPMAIIGLFFTMIFLTLQEPAIKQFDLYTALMLIMRLYVMTAYMLTGMRYAEYSVNTVYYNALASRKDTMLMFLEGEGMKAVITANDAYKYKALIKENNNG